MTEPRVIKKYENRRLYDTEGSRYVNLDEVAKMVRDGIDVQVVDAKTGDDLTRLVLTQIIVDDSRDAKGGGPPLDFLRDLIKTRDQANSDFLQWYLGTAAAAYQKVQEAWQGRPSWPSLAEQRKAWAKMFDPFGVMGERQPQPSESEEPPAEQDDASSAGEDLADLRKRLEELEARLTKD